jgi:tRNA (guanine37-N1)-methyltransferase
VSDGCLSFEVFTLFPGIVESFLSDGLMAKAIERGALRVDCTNYRDFTDDPRGTVDDAPFGGGGGMLIRPEPVVEALESVARARGPMHRILLTPSAPRFDQRVAERLARLDRIALLCGRYEGIDDRVREGYVDECLSIGDFVLNGGEVAAAAIIEAVARLRDGVLGNRASIETESFASGDAEGLLEHPHYTRPRSFRGVDVPEHLIDGDHARVHRWRMREACLRTWALRPELRLQHDGARAIGHTTHLLVWPRSGPRGGEPIRRIEGLLSSLSRGAERKGQVLCLGQEVRDLADLRRRFRRAHGVDPVLLGLSVVERASPLEGDLDVAVDMARLVRDLHESVPTPVVLVPDPGESQAVGDPAEQRIRKIREACDAHILIRGGHGKGLAKGVAMIDVSQPDRDTLFDTIEIALECLVKQRTTLSGMPSS